MNETQFPTARRRSLLTVTIASLSLPLAGLANPPSGNGKPRSQSAPPKVNISPRPAPKVDPGAAATELGPPSQNNHSNLSAGGPQKLTGKVSNSPYGRIPRAPSNTEAADSNPGKLPGPPARPYGTLPKVLSNPGIADGVPGELPKPPGGPYGRIPKVTADDAPGELPKPPVVGQVPSGSRIKSIGSSFVKVNRVGNSAKGFEAVGADFSESESGFGNAMVNLMRDHERVATLGAAKEGDIRWVDGMAAAFKPHAADLARALDTGAMIKRTTAEDAPGLMAGQVTTMGASLATRPMLVMETITKNSQKLNGEVDPEKRQQLAATLQSNARELVSFLTNSEAKLAISGKVMTDPKVLATLPSATRNLTLDFGQRLLKLRGAYQEPGGIIQSSLALGNRILSSPEEAVRVASEFGEANPGPLPPLPPSASSLRSSQSGRSLGPLPALPPANSGSSQSAEP